MLDRIAEGRTDLVVDWVHEGGAADAHARGHPLIAWCAYHGDVTGVRFLVERGESLATLGEDRGLVGAAFHGFWKLCQFLLERGADPDHALPDTGETALHAALSKANRPQYDEVVRVLLAAGADPGARTRVGVETGGFMRDARTRGETPLHRAAAFGTEAAVRLLLDAGADPEVKDANGDSPLTWASWHLRPPTILRLLCYGDFRVHPDNRSTYDHGRGWEQPQGRPIL